MRYYERSMYAISIAIICAALSHVVYEDYRTPNSGRMDNQTESEPRYTSGNKRNL